MGLRELLIAGTITTSHTDQYEIKYRSGFAITSYEQIEDIKSEIMDLDEAIINTMRLKASPNTEEIEKQDRTNKRLLKRFIGLFEKERVNPYKIKKKDVKRMFEVLTKKDFPKDLKIKRSRLIGYNPQENLFYIPRKGLNTEILILNSLHVLGVMAFYSKGTELNEDNLLLMNTAGNLFELAYVSNSNSSLRSRLERERENTIYACQDDVNFNGWLLADALVSISNNNPAQAYNKFLKGDFDLDEWFNRGISTGENYCMHHSRAALLYSAIINPNGRK